ncbi:MAG: ribosomal RNA small subunit methyltransferase A [Nitrospirae bacterium]|nr:ribosomal RNA small subunit methyltransferase A [Nitrospirota bacterium]
MTKKHLGQHFLYDPSILNRIIEGAELHPGDIVVEIGPGHGRMTRMLAEKVKKVIAIELDDKLYESLKKELSGYENVELIHEDALKYPYETLPYFKVVANIPYYITTPLIFRLLEMKQTYHVDTQKTTGRKNLETMTLTVQKEVAERIVAKPGNKHYGILSIMVQFYAKPGLKFIIPKKAFRPVPKVDSAVIHLEIYGKPYFHVKDEDLFFRIIKTAFSKRRKMLSNSLKLIRQDVKDWLVKAGIDPDRRPETLSIEEFARLANVYN